VVRLRQVLVNLIDNALKFTPQGGTVMVRLSGGPDMTTISVADSGPGLSPEDLDHLFKPFTPLSAQPTGGESSTGLGLSICQEIVAMHRGRITVNSALAHGTTFTVHLPVDSPA
jgi:signal transduction histidine kinase